MGGRIFFLYHEVSPPREPLKPSASPIYSQVFRKTKPPIESKHPPFSQTLQQYANMRQTPINIESIGLFDNNPIDREWSERRDLNPSFSQGKPSALDFHITIVVQCFARGGADFRLANKSASFAKIRNVKKEQTS